MTLVIAPSRRLRILHIGFGASLCAAAWAAGPATPSSFTAGPLVALALLFAGLCVVHAALRPAMVNRIDISGPGQLRLTVQQGVRPDKCGAMSVRLLPGSTLWPRMLLLRLETAGNGDAGTAAECAHLRGVPRWFTRRRHACHNLVVLTDSVSPEGFRALAVALAAQAATAGGAATEHQIG